MERNELFGSEPEAGTVIDFEPVLGTWVNSNTETRWIKAFTLSQDGGELMIQFEHAGNTAETPMAQVTPFLDNIGERAFTAACRWAGVNALLAANMNKGLWVIAAFLEFTDKTRPNFLCREFYYRA